MVLTVNQELCAGCGVCIEACSAGAIQLIDYRAMIDGSLCTQCEACADACPNGAITAISEPVQLMPTRALTVTETQAIPSPTRVALPTAEPPNHGLAALAGTALAFLGREVAPRLVDALATALESRLTRPATNARTSSLVSSKSPTSTSRGIRRQTRYRGRRSDNRIVQERK
jgi:NAD-dependent dihydropyrimidine dehydrogenase PreA subunit